MGLQLGDFNGLQPRGCSQEVAAKRSQLRGCSPRVVDEVLQPGFAAKELARGCSQGISQWLQPRGWGQRAAASCWRQGIAARGCSQGLQPSSCSQGVAAKGWRPKSRSQGVVARGCSQEVAATSCYMSIILGSTFWPQHSGLNILASTFWAQHSGLNILGSTFWAQHSGLNILG